MEFLKKFSSKLNFSFSISFHKLWINWIIIYRSVIIVVVISRTKNYRSDSQVKSSLPDSPIRCVAIRRRVSFQIKRVTRNVLSYTRCSNNSRPRTGGYIYLRASTIFVAREKNFLFLPFSFFLLSPSTFGALVKTCHYRAVFSTSLLE